MRAQITIVGLCVGLAFCALADLSDRVSQLETSGVAACERE